MDAERSPDARRRAHCRYHLLCIPECEGCQDVADAVAQAEKERDECVIAGHDAPLESVPDGVADFSAPIRCRHCARDMRLTLQTNVEELEAAHDRENGWQIQSAQQMVEINALRDRLMDAQNTADNVRSAWDREHAQQAEEIARLTAALEAVQHEVKC